MLTSWTLANISCAQHSALSVTFGNLCLTYRKPAKIHLWLLQMYTTLMYLTVCITFSIFIFKYYMQLDERF